MMPGVSSSWPHERYSVRSPELQATERRKHNRATTLRRHAMNSREDTSRPMQDSNELIIIHRGHNRANPIVFNGVSLRQERRQSIEELRVYPDRFHASA